MTRGYELPPPPAPRYGYPDTSALQVPVDWALSNALPGTKPWSLLCLDQAAGLPPALTVREAISDLPPLLLDVATGECGQGQELMLYPPASTPNAYQRWCRQGCNEFLADHQRTSHGGERRWSYHLQQAHSAVHAWWSAQRALALPEPPDGVRSPSHALLNSLLCRGSADRVGRACHDGGRQVRHRQQV